MTRLDNSASRTGEPWWRVGMLWLVVGGPLAVVVASLVTAVIAYRGADPVLDEYQNAGRQSAQADSKTPVLPANKLAASSH
jgi:hypothetical protein